MRIPGSRLVAAVILVSVALAACGTGEGDEELKAAQERSLEALEEIELLRDRLDDLAGDVVELRSDDDELRNDDDDLGARLDSVNGRFKKSLGKLESSLADLEGSTATATSNADDALGVAGEAAREISILTNRLDYHLRNHGDG